MTKIVSYKELVSKLPVLPLETIQRLGVDAQGRILVVDGVLGPKTKGASYLEPESVEHPLVSCALGELVLGAEEEGGNNLGQWVRKYMGKDWVGGPWCAGFVSWCLDQTYDDPPYIRGARRLANEVAEEGEQVGVRFIQPGDIISWKRSSGGSYAGHIGIVCAVTCDHVYSIEGNAGPKGAVRVWRYALPDLERSGDPIWKIARWS